MAPTPATPSTHRRWSPTSALVIASTLLVLGRPAHADDAPLQLDLAKALELAQEHSLVAADRRDELSAARHRRDALFAGYLSRLAFSARYTRQNEVEPAALALPGAPEPLLLGEAISDVYSLRLTLDQPIFDGFARRNQVAAADHAATAAALRIELEEADLDVRVEEAYFGLLGARAMVDVASGAVDTFGAHIDDLVELREAGVATNADVAEARSQLATARVTLAHARTSEEIGQAALVMLLGLPDGARVELTEVLADATSTEEDAASLTAEALDHRIERRIAAAGADAAGAKVRAAAAPLWPQLALRAGVAYEQPNARYFPPEQTFDTSWDVSLVLSWNLDAGVTYHTMRAAELDASVARRAQRELDEGIRFEVVRRRAEVTSAAERAVAAAEAITAAEVAKVAAAEMCAAGGATCTRVLDAEWELIGARAEALAARIDSRLATVRLERAVGR